HLGYKYAADVTWKIAFCLDACSGQISGRKILEWCYKVDFVIDQSGYTRRTCAGHVVIPMTRRAPNDGPLVDPAERLREQITPQLAIGFRRVSQTFPLSEDKRRLDFTIVDEQMPPNVPPPNVVIAEASHSVDNEFRTFVRSMQTIRASYEVVSTR